MWYCEACKKDNNCITKSSHIKSQSHIENEVFSGINDNLSGKIYTYLNLELDQRDGFFTRSIDDCSQFFHRFNYKCVIVVKFNHETHGTKTYFTSSNKFNIQFEQINEAKEVSKQIDKDSEEGSSYRF